MKVVFLAAVSSLLVLAVSASEDEKDLIQKSKTFMDNYNKDVINELKKLKTSGKKYSSKDLKALVTNIAAEAIAKQDVKLHELEDLKNKLEKAGKIKDFKIYEHGSPELKKELGNAALDLLSQDEVAPRVIGALVMGLTQLATDTVRMSTTRYGEMPDSHKVQYAPIG